jgi:nitroreductase
MDAEEVLTTTRAVRKRIDLGRTVPLELIAECIEVALQAPSGGNRQGWHFVVVTDPEKKAQIADYYRRSWAAYKAAQRWDYAQEDPRQQRKGAVIDSAQYLADHFHEVPVHVIPCIEGRSETLTHAATAALFGSVLPATWSFMLAARARGLGSSLTTLHLVYEAEVAEILGIPPNVNQCALVPVGYLLGETLRPARRLEVSQVASLDGWTQPLTAR